MRDSVVAYESILRLIASSNPFRMAWIKSRSSLMWSRPIQIPVSARQRMTDQVRKQVLDLTEQRDVALEAFRNDRGCRSLLGRPRQAANLQDCVRHGEPSL